jgi:MFS family permease
LLTSNRNRTLSIVSAVIALLFFWSSLYTYVPILPTHALAAGATDAQMGLILSSYGLTQLLFRLPLGLLSDRLRRKKIFALLGTLLVTASALGLAYAKTPLGLFLFRALSGCAATAWVTITVLYNSHFPIEQAVRSAGQLNLLAAIGQIVAMSSGGWIAQNWGAQATFFASALLSLPAFAAFSLVRDVRASRGQGITWPAFGRAISTPRLLLVSGLAACSQFAFFATALGYAAVHARAHSASDAQLGILTTAVQISKALPSLLLSIRRKPHQGHGMVMAGLALVGTPLFFFPALTDLRWMIGAQALIGLGVGMSFPVLMGLALQSVEPEARASAMGVFQSIYALGMTLGPLTSGFIAGQWGIWGVYLTNGVLLLVATAVAILFLRPQSQMETA